MNSKSDKYGWYGRYERTVEKVPRSRQEYPSKLKYVLQAEDNFPRLKTDISVSFLINYWKISHQLCLLNLRSESPEQIQPAVTNASFFQTWTNSVR